jgi:hypothetical protein
LSLWAIEWTVVVVSGVSGSKSKKRKPTGAARRGSAPRRATVRRWSAHVTKESNALDLEPGVFTWHDPKTIAASLKRSAELSRRRKSDPYRSALSMLVFYVNRAGTNLSAVQRRTLEQAKVELRKQFARK